MCFRLFCLLSYHNQTIKMHLKNLRKQLICLLIILQIISCAPQPQLKPNQSFPQLLWAFWDGKLDNPNSNIFLKLCLNNMKNYAQKSGWQFNLVTYQNLPQFLSKDNYDQCMKLVSFINPDFKQMRADIVRLFLLKENGGMWLDASTFFVQDLTWINDISNSKLPFNKISSYPDFIAFRIAQYDKPQSQIWDQNLEKFVLVSPGIQNWAMIAKKNVTFIQDSLKIIEQIINKGDQALKDKAIDQGVVLSPQANNSYFKFGIYTFQHVLQFKQRDLDQYHANLDLSAPNANKLLPKYAVDYYKIWTIDGHDMGFNLENITDGIAPFLTVLFLYSDYRLIDQLKIELKGFIKLGGVKRKYIQIMLQNMISPQMCLITAEDTYTLSNQSYIYKHLIEDYNQPSGLVLKNHIKNIDEYIKQQEKTCQVTQQDQKLTKVENQIDRILFYLCILISFMALVCFFWIKCNRLSRFECKNLLYFSIAALFAIVIIFSPKSFRLQENNKNTNEIANNTCVMMKFQLENQEYLKSQGYLKQLKGKLPDDNGQLFTMFFQQKIQGLKGGFSQFMSTNQTQFHLYFSKYLVGIFLLLFFLIRNRIPILCKIANYINCRTSTKKILIILGICFLFITFFISLVTFKKAVALNESTQKSMCYFIQMPRLTSNQTQLFKNNQTNGANYLESFATLNNEFHKIYKTIITYQGAFLKQSPQYFNQMQQTKKLLNSSNTSDKQLLTLIESKQTLLKMTQESSNRTYKTLICQHNFNHLINFVLTNLNNLRLKLQYFLNNFVKLQTFSFALSTLPIAISLIFCILSGILFINNFKKWRAYRAQMYFKKYRSTIIVLSILGLMVSFGFDSIVLGNYYFCNNLQALKHSFQENPEQLLKVIPDKCISASTTDIFQKNLKQNFQLRQKPFKDFVGLSSKMQQLANFPYDQEQRLLSTYSGDSIIAKFHQSNQNYNSMLQKYSQSYFNSKNLVEKQLQVKYNIPEEIHALRDYQKIFYQPLCVFNFNILYQMAFLFGYFTFLNLTILFITILLEPKDIALMAKNEQISVADAIENEKSPQKKQVEMSRISIKQQSQVKLESSSFSEIKKHDQVVRPQSNNK